MSNTNAASTEIRTIANFLRDQIAEDVRTNKFGDAVVQTRFPPEPNGYLHIGHAKAICLDFGLADEFGGKTNLRFDDTNPQKEEQEYVDSIQADLRWLGFEWEQALLRVGLFRPALRVGGEAHQGGQGVCRRPDRRRDSPVSRHADRARQGQPVSQSHRRRKPGPVCAHEGGRVPRRLARAARQDRHGLAQHQHARSGDVSHSARHASSHRRRVVHLSDVRLRARPVGLD